jgi:nucleoside-diphosphate-sugar epimerase
LGLAKFLGAAIENVYGALGIKSEPPLTRFVVEQLSTSHCFNINAARNDLGYAPKVSMQEGLVRLAQYLTRSRMQTRA